ncbi:MAG: ribonuclease HII [Sulfurovum sp.]|nr:ribonuclease HII [Sulfurovum sp.]MDD3601930.1 ribonuclease HII [Sulfurovum sp.]
MFSKPLCGIDEAGRGPLAGPLVMAGVVPERSLVDIGLADSKKLTEKKREMLYELITQNARFHIVSFSAAQIDQWGISKCLQKGLQSIQAHLPHCDYLFDGNSTFGAKDIRTMIKADDKIPEVSAASILAKVTRDREMKALARKYPDYGFEKHKGYGTKAHIEALSKYGRCKVHRYTFRVKELDQPTLFNVFT